MPYDMFMGTFPIMLNIRDRQAVVVGGGPVGVRKVRSLLEAGAKVRLVARRTNPQVQQLQQVGVDLRIEDYRPQLLEGALLVFACTDDRDLNALIARDARQAGALVNAADQPEDEADAFGSPSCFWVAF